MSEKKRLTQADILEALQAQHRLFSEAIEKILGELADQAAAHNAIMAIMATDLGRLVAAMQDDAPNYRHPLAAYGSFNWDSIGANVAGSDGDGVTAVSWNGYQWKRRSGSGSFGKAIWFSRPNGKDAEGKVRYIRLITFSDLEDAKPLSFETASNGNNDQAKRHPDPQNEPAGDPHLTYGDKTAVPANKETILIFNAYLYANQKKPADSAELKAWHEQQQVEAPQS